MADPDFQVKVVRWDGNCVGTVVPTKKQFEMFYLPLLGLPDSLVVSFRAVQRAYVDQPGVGHCLFLTGDGGPKFDRTYGTFASKLRVFCAV